MQATCGCHVSKDGRITQQCAHHAGTTQLQAEHSEEIAELESALSASEERVRVLSEAIRKARPKMEEAFQTARKDGLIETIEERHAWSYIWTASQLLLQALKRDKP